ncbi:MAG: hypothetical protein HY737_03580 [Candidatus Omnitrophica bacterium]|nr:hypothetical protein [Candidatus Omnitrophota bacterium]
MTSSSNPRVGFLSLGTMGTPMAINLLKAGFPLTVWNRMAACPKQIHVKFIALLNREYLKASQS